ncbi:MAG: DUF1778 domain-containing protein [Rhizonema sp. PD38]|nr:DUF1778 domain-containing protein [Rhizonema sp. PD38]
MTIQDARNQGKGEGTHGKLERLEARLTREQKELLQQAASLEGRTLTDFVVSSAHAAALRTIQEHTLMSLTKRDSEAFVEALLNPPEPGAALLAAAKRYKQSMEFCE